MKCPNCGTDNNEQRIVCKSCQIEFTPEMRSIIKKKEKRSQKNNMEKPKSNKMVWGFGLEILGVILFFGGCAKLDDGGSAWMVLGFILCIGSIFIFVNNQSQQDKEEVKKKSDFNQENQIPYTAREIKMYLGDYKVSYNIWKENRNLFLANTYNTGQCLKRCIEIKDIISYNIIGDAYTETNVKGGGSSLTGAVVGGVIAGGAGAVIGSRKKIETETKRIDERKTVLTYNENGTTKNIFFSPDTYEILLELIPEKDINFINSSIISKPSNEVKVEIEDNVYIRIRELSKLKDDGILTEDEFKEKKKQLLEKIK